MDEDDPERRIAELERQHAESSAASAAHGELTPADVRNAAFSKPPWGKRGYNEDEVDALLDRVEAEIRGLGGV